MHVWIWVPKGALRQASIDTKNDCTRAFEQMMFRVEP